MYISFWVNSHCKLIFKAEFYMRFVSFGIRAKLPIVHVPNMSKFRIDCLELKAMHLSCNCPFKGEPWSEWKKIKEMANAFNKMLAGENHDKPQSLPSPPPCGLTTQNPSSYPKQPKTSTDHSHYSIKSHDPLPHVETLSLQTTTFLNQSPPEKQQTKDTYSPIKPQFPHKS